MIDLGKWIYSQDIARWLLTRPALDVREQMDCILSAPHRNLEEKLDGLRELEKEEGSLGFLKDKIEAAETLKEVIRQFGGLRNVYETSIFYYGKKEELTEKKIFTSPAAGIDWIREQIQETADRYEVDVKGFFGVLHKYYRRGSKYLDLEWNMILNPQGKLIYCLPENEIKTLNDYWIGPQDDYYLKLPYPTGTIVKTAENPFFRRVKGVVVNEREPWENGFAEDNDQWLLYKDFYCRGQGTGIGVVGLNDYASITFGADYFLPFRQLLVKCEEELSDNEKWLVKLGEMVREDKRCFGVIMKEKMPGKVSGEKERYEEYVDSLWERWKRGEL